MQLTAPKISQEIRDTFVAEPFVSAISTPDLTQAQAGSLLDCINGLRSGQKMYYVRVGHNKTGKGRKRMPGVDYEADPTLSPKGHEGWLYAAPTNQKRKVYLRMKDEARAKPDQEPEIDLDTGLPKVQWNYTCVTLANLFSFKVLGSAPGPLAPVESKTVAAPVLDTAAQQVLLAEAFQMGMTIQANANAAQNNSPPIVQ